VPDRPPAGCQNQGTTRTWGEEKHPADSLGPDGWPIACGESEVAMAADGPVRRWSTRTAQVVADMRVRARHRFDWRRRRPAAAFDPVGAHVVSPVDLPEPAEPGEALETISTLDELDAKLREVDAAWAVSDDAMRRVFRSFRMVAGDDLPADPSSPEYSAWQFNLYRRIAARDYEVANERPDFPVDANRPFPYYTESFETVGQQLMGLGFIIRSMGLPAGASVLELGAGWGNTTVALSRMGYDVTAVDIDPTFVNLILTRAAKFGLTIDARCSTFLEIDQLDRQFDGVLFFESFHHCSDHRSLLTKLAGVINPAGRVFFAAEPIDETFPMPWGLRLDGESLWAIRQNGWLELGFQESYFLRTLQHLGWLAVKHVTPATHLGVIFEARRAVGRYQMSTFRMPPDEDATWAPSETDGDLKQRYSARSSVLSVQQGLAPGYLEIDAVNASSRPLPFQVRHGRHAIDGTAGPREELVIQVPYDPGGNQLVIDATTWRPSDFGSADHREIGLGVRTVSWIADADRV
jgi:2-polyprenyl-3-methyl-5-hydroxy-6-metoxy-1,4-benzoquinol methylase